MALRAARVPSMLYGTAWKQENTSRLVKDAVLAGFRGIDTAAQPKHYQEHLVGEGIRDALRTMTDLRREDLYIQTKFTSIYGQDPSHTPYDIGASVTEQVKQSVASSLKNLRHDDETPSDSSYVDCLVLHSPLDTVEETMEAWSAMESFVPNAARTLGISNVYNHALLQLICNDQFSRIKPSVVQNRFYAGNDYDVPIRDVCAQNGIAYQTFWTLTGNPDLVASEPVSILAAKAKVSKEAALYAFVQGLGSNISVLNGTTNSQRMKDDLKAMEMTDAFQQTNSNEWQDLLQQFKDILNSKAS